MELMRVNWSLNFICEFLSMVPCDRLSVTATNVIAVFLFPWPLIYNLNLNSRGERLGLTLLFTLGLVTLAVSTGRFVTMLQVSNFISICKSLANFYPYVTLINIRHLGHS